jgi:transposase, IS5 family
MAQRRIGQEVFRFGRKAERQTNLDALAALIDWTQADRLLAGLYPAPKGEKAWPPLAMFKALLLATWYDLSDVMLAEALSDRASFRRFCGFARDEVTPERTAFVRFRRRLVEHGLDQSLFAAIARDLASKGATVRKGTLIDATVIGSVSKKDKEAAWAKHKSRARRMAIRRILPPTRTPASSARLRRRRPMRLMSISRLRSSPMSRARFTPTEPTMRFRSRRRSKPKAEPRS